MPTPCDVIAAYLDEPVVTAGMSEAEVVDEILNRTSADAARGIIVALASAGFEIRPYRPTATAETGPDRSDSGGEG